jgi:hypothetical protein
MDVKGNRLTGLLVLFISLLAALAVAALFYFLKIQQNEHYQNQLHFRELNRYVESLEQNKQSLEAAYDAYVIDSQLRYENIDSLISQLEIMKEQAVSYNKHIKVNDSENCESDSCREFEQMYFSRNTLPIFAAEFEIIRSIEEALLDEFSSNEIAREKAIECFKGEGKRGVSKAAMIAGYKSCRDKARTIVSRKTNGGDYRDLGSFCLPHVKVCLSKDKYMMQANLSFANAKNRKISNILNSSSLIPLVILVDSNGKLIHKAENILNDSAQHGLRFEQLEQILYKFNFELEVDNNSTDNKSSKKIFTPGASSYLDTVIAGTEYRIFLQPWPGVAAELSDRNEIFYLLGLQSKSAMLGDKLSVSNSLVLVFTLIFIGAVAFLPLFKVRLVSTQQGFSRNDLKIIPFSLAIICVVVAVSSFQYLFYIGMKHSINKMAEISFSEIKISFSNEIKDWFEVAESRLPLLKEKSRNYEGYSNADDEVAELNALHKCNIYGEYPQIDCFLEFNVNDFMLFEGIYEINQDGTDVDALGGVVSKAQNRRYSYSVRDRSYVNHSVNCTGWHWPPDEVYPGDADCRNTFFVERLRNKIDLRLNTWVGMPLFRQVYSEESKAKDQDIIIFGGQLKTFFLAVLPKDFRFLVFENESGDVLYHSDEWLSKIDNIFADTDNDLHLRNLVKANYDQPKMFETLYKGKDTVFQLGAIATNVPWTLVVMYDKSPYRLINLLSAFSSWTLSFFYLLIVYIFWRTQPGKLQQMIHSIIWFRADRHLLYISISGALTLNLLIAAGLFLFASDSAWFTLITALLIAGVYLWAVVNRYRTAIVSKNREIMSLQQSLITSEVSKMLVSESKVDQQVHQIDRPRHPLLAYSLFVLLLLLNFCAIPSVMFSYQASEYLLYRQAELNKQYLMYSVDARQKEMREYVDVFFDAEVFKDESKNDVLKKTRVNCYPKAVFGKEFDDRCIVQNNGYNGDLGILRIAASIFNSNTHGNVLFGQIPWLLADVKLPMFSHIWALQQQSMPGDEETSTGPRPQINKLLGFGAPNNVFWTGVLTALALLLLLLLIRYWLCRRMMGLDRVENFRINPENIKASKYEAADALRRILYPHRGGSGKSVYLQLIRPSVATQTLVSDSQPSTQDPDDMNGRKDECLIAGINPVDVCDLLLPKKPCDSSAQSDNLPTMVLTGFEPLIWNKALRLKVLKKLQQLVSNGKVSLVLMMEMSPLYRLTQPIAYDEKFPVEQQADAAERDAWVKFFVRFIKIYDWVPKLRHKHHLETPADVLWYEANSWPELEHIAIQFLAYHCAVKDPELEHELKLTAGTTNYYCSDLAKYWQNFCLEFRGLKDLPAKKRLCHFKPGLSKKIYESINKKWTKEQIIDFFNSTAATRYEAKWQLCTIKEKVLLISMINGDLPNPRNSVPLEHLVRRGYIFYDQGWHIVNESFSRFIATAEDPDTVRRWMREVSESLWKYARIPLFIGLLLLLGLLAYTATDSLQSLMALMATMLGIIPVIFNNISLFKGGSNSGS